VVFTSVSNQIVNDLCSLARASFDTRANGWPRKPFRTGATDFPHAAQPVNSVEFLKDLTGRPYSAPDGGPPGVLLPFLTGDLANSIPFAGDLGQSPATRSPIGDNDQSNKGLCAPQAPFREYFVRFVTGGSGVPALTDRARKFLSNRSVLFPLGYGEIGFVSQERLLRNFRLSREGKFFQLEDTVRQQFA
jgi:hypothetical protein